MCEKKYSYTKRIWWITCKRTRTLFKSNNSAATIVVGIDEGSTRWSATWKCALRIRTAGKTETSSALTVPKYLIKGINTQWLSFSITSYSLIQQKTICAPTYSRYYLRIKKITANGILVYYQHFWWSQSIQRILFRFNIPHICWSRKGVTSVTQEVCIYRGARNLLFSATFSVFFR